MWSYKSWMRFALCIFFNIEHFCIQCSNVSVYLRYRKCSMEGSAWEKMVQRTEIAFHHQGLSRLDSWLFYGALRKTAEPPPPLPHTHTHTCRWMDRERWRAKVEAVWLILSSSVRKDWKRWVRAIESFWWGGLRLTDMHTNRYFLTGCQTDSSPYKPNFISQFLAPILNTLTRIDALTQTNI